MFSAVNAALLAKNALTKLKIIRKMPLSMPPLVCLEAESYGPEPTLATGVTRVESTRTEYSVPTAIVITSS